MQGIASVNQRAIEDAFLGRNLLVERRIAVDVFGRWVVGAEALFFYVAQILGPAALVDVFETRLPMAVERRPAEIRLEQVMDECELSRYYRIDVRNPLRVGKHRW